MRPRSPFTLPPEFQSGCMVNIRAPITGTEVIIDGTILMIETIISIGIILTGIK